MKLQFALLFDRLMWAKTRFAPGKPRPKTNAIIVYRRRTPKMDLFLIAFILHITLSLSSPCFFPLDRHNFVFHFIVEPISFGFRAFVWVSLIAHHCISAKIRLPLTPRTKQQRDRGRFSPLYKHFSRLNRKTFVR